MASAVSSTFHKAVFGGKAVRVAQGVRGKVGRLSDDFYRRAQQNIPREWMLRLFKVIAIRNWIRSV
jgi:hypothetical protein